MPSLILWQSSSRIARRYLPATDFSSQTVQVPCSPSTVLVREEFARVDAPSESKAVHQVATETCQL